MAIPTLESLTANADAKVVGLLGDTITYKIGSGSPKSFMAFVDYGEGVRNFGDSAAINQRMSVQARRVDIPSRPVAADRVTLPKLAGKTFQPIDPELDESGDWWNFNLKLVP